MYSRSVRSWSFIVSLPQTTEKVRRTPRQRRSQATVDALLTAATQILARDGSERFTTTATAERAGVSIGSLYQYYRNRDALLAAVATRELQRLAREITNAFQSALPGTRVEAVSRAIVANVFAASAERKAALSCVLAFTNRMNVGDDVRAFMATVARQLAVERQLTQAETFVLTRAVLGVANAALIENPELDPDEVAQALSVFVRSSINAGK